MKDKQVPHHWLIVIALVGAAIGGYAFGQFSKSCTGEVVRALRFYGVSGSVQLDRPLPDEE